MSALAAILAGVAARVGAPLVKELLERHVGGTGAAIGGAIIDAIAGKAGVPAEDLPSLPPDRLEAAVRAVEDETPELVAAWARQQELANELMRTEMDKGPAWTWAWRPATMWLIGFLWVWSLVLVPALNVALRAAVPTHLPDLVWLTTAYMALYMGGHTAKEIFARQERGDERE